jgi:hypothetical protein
VEKAVVKHIEEVPGAVNKAHNTSKEEEKDS